MSELEYLRSEYQRIRDLLDRRPALNEGLLKLMKNGRLRYMQAISRFPLTLNAM